MALRHYKSNLEEEQIAGIRKIYTLLGKEKGGPGGHAARATVINRLLPDLDWTNRYVDAEVAWKEIVRSIRARDPVIMSTSLTESGHVILIVGYEIGSGGARTLVVHDPAGEFDFRFKDGGFVGGKDGNEVRYPLSFLKVRVEYELTGEGAEDQGVLRYRRISLGDKKGTWTEVPAGSLAQRIRDKHGLRRPGDTKEYEDWEYLIRKRHIGK